MKTLTLCFLIAATPLLAAPANPSVTSFGQNLMLNGDFEEGDPAAPDYWTILPNLPDGAVVLADTEGALTGRQALKISVPESGERGVQVVSTPIEVTAGKFYLFSFGYRQENCGKMNESGAWVFAGISPSGSIAWLDAVNQEISRQAVVLPYSTCPWALKDQIFEAPKDAASVVINFSIHNDSLNVNQTNIPATLWLDAAQWVEYTPPSEPVSGSDVQTLSFDPTMETTWQALSQWGETVDDAKARDGTALEALQAGEGYFAHSPYMEAVPHGLYRIKARIAVPANNSEVIAGYVDVTSQYAASRAEMNVIPNKAPADGEYADIQRDFIVRDNGWWSIRAHTSGEQKWRIDSIEVVPLQLFSNADLQQVLPGYEVATPKDLRSTNQESAK